MFESESKNEKMQFLDKSRTEYMRRIFSFFYNLIVVVLAHAGYLITVMILAVVAGLVIPHATAMSFRFMLILGPVIILIIMSRFTAHYRQTPGNKSMGLVIVRDDGSSVSFGTSILRNFLLVVLALPVGFGLLWALFDPQAKGLHDRLTNTRLSNVPGAQALRIPIFHFVIFILAITCTLLFIPAFAVLSNVWPSPDLFLGSLFVLLIIIPVTFILSIIGRWTARKNPLARMIAKTSLAITVISGIGVILFAITIPSNMFLHSVQSTTQCEEDLVAIGTAMEQYIRERGCYPERLDDLIDEEYLVTMPLFRHSEQYCYAIEYGMQDTVFIIRCPHTSGLLKERGLLPVRRLIDLKYKEKRGLMAVTE